MRKLPIKPLDSMAFFGYSLACSVATFLIVLIVGLSYRYFVDGVNLLAGDPYIPQTLSPLMKSSLTESALTQFMSAVVIAPLLETFLHQFIVISILYRLRLNELAIVVIATLLFSLGHLRNGLLSVINTLFLGFALNYAYIHWLERTNSKRVAFESAMLIHALHNFYLVFWSLVGRVNP